MEQASELAQVAKLARKKKNLDIICFSGYRFERLIQAPPNPGVASLLGEVDLLIDGPYVRSRNESDRSQRKLEPDDLST